MIKEDLIKELNVLFSDFLSKENIELVDLICRDEGNKLILKVLADKPQDNSLTFNSQNHKNEGKITLQECARANVRLNDLLAEKDIIDGDYVLEVSSPGLDRDLKNPKDFLRSMNKEVVFYLNDLINGKCQWQGVVSKVDQVNVFIDNSGKLLGIPLIKINKARLVV